MAVARRVARRPPAAAAGRGDRRPLRPGAAHARGRRRRRACSCVPPRRRRLERLALGRAIRRARRGAAAAADSGFGELDRVRDYQPGDPLSRVHWAQTAKRGRLQTKELRAPPRVRAHGGGAARTAPPPPGDDFETAVTAAAALARHLAERGEPVALAHTGRRAGAAAGRPRGLARRWSSRSRASQAGGERALGLALRAEADRAGPAGPADRGRDRGARPGAAAAPSPRAARCGVAGGRRARGPGRRRRRPSSSGRRRRRHRQPAATAWPPRSPPTRMAVPVSPRDGAARAAAVLAAARAPSSRGLGGALRGRRAPGRLLRRWRALAAAAGARRAVAAGAGPPAVAGALVAVAARARGMAAAARRPCDAARARTATPGRRRGRDPAPTACAQGSHGGLPGVARRAPRAGGAAGHRASRRSCGAGRLADRRARAGRSRACWPWASGLAYRWTVRAARPGGGRGARWRCGLAAVLALATWDGGGADRALPPRRRRAGARRRVGGARRRPRHRPGAGRRRLVGVEGLGGRRRRPPAAVARPAPELRRPRLARRAAGRDDRRLPRGALPLRAVSLDEFDGVSFTPAGGGGSSQALPDRRRHHAPPGSRRPHVGARARPSASPWSARAPSSCCASGRARGASGAVLGDGRPGGGRRAGGRRRCSPGDRYTVATLIPRPTPAELVAARPTTRRRAGGRDPPARDAAADAGRDPAVGQRRLPGPPTAPRALRAGAGAGAVGRRRRGHAVRGGQPHRVLPAQELHLRRGPAVPDQPARRHRRRRPTTARRWSTSSSTAGAASASTSPAGWR